MPPLASRRVVLRPVDDGDVPFLYDLMAAPEAGAKVRFGGATPSPEQVSRAMWDSVLAQFVVSSRRTQEPIGLFVVASPNFRDGFAYLSAIARPDLHGSGRMVEGVMVGTNYAFATWPFRKLYMEVASFNLTPFRSALDRYLVEEGRLRDHVFYADAYHDVHILAIYRQTWREAAAKHLARLCRTD